MKTKLGFFILFFLISVLMIIATFYDLPINQALNDPNSFFAIFFRGYAETPAYLNIVLLPTLIVIKFKGYLKPIYYYSLLVLIILISTICFNHFLGRYSSYLIGISISLLISLWSIFIVYVVISKFEGNKYINYQNNDLSKIDSDTITDNEVESIIDSTLIKDVESIYDTITTNKKTTNKFNSIELIYEESTINKLLIIVIIASLLTISSTTMTTLLKNLWGRVRFYESIDSFTPWYQINLGSSSRSFPSGHVTAASTIIAYTLIPSIFKVSRKTFIFIYSIIIFWIVSSAVSRIIIGAHYLSDVVIAFTLVFIQFIIIKKLFIKYLTKKLKIKKDLD